MVLEAVSAGNLRTRTFDVNQPVARSGILNDIYGSEIFQRINYMLR